MAQENYVYQGCYKDDGVRAIPDYNHNVKSVEECGQIAKNRGASVFGLQYGGQCWTGNDVNGAQRYGSTENCPALGGAWTNQIYTVTSEENINIIEDSDYQKYSNYQSNVKNITSLELSRIESKKAQLYEQKDNANRMIQLNTSYRDKQKQYILMVLVIVLTCLFCFCLFWLKSTFGIKNQIIEILIIVGIVCGILSVFFMYMDILSRDSIYFDKLNDNALLQVQDMSGNINLPNRNVVAASPTCKGAECCGPGFAYDSSNNLCYKRI